MLLAADAQPCSTSYATWWRRTAASSSSRPRPGPYGATSSPPLDPRHRREDARRARHVLHQVAVWEGREQVHLDLGNHVAAHDKRDAPARGPRSSATVSRPPPAPGRESARRRRAPPEECARVQVIEVLAGRDRHLELTPEVGETRPRPGGGPDLPATRCPRPAARGPRGGRASATSSDCMSTMTRTSSAHGLAHGLHAPHLQLRGRLPPEPQLHGAEARSRRGASPRPRGRRATGCTRGRRSRTSGAGRDTRRGAGAAGWPSVLPLASHTAMSSGASAQWSRPPGPAQSPRRAKRSQAASGSSTLMPIRCSPSSRAAWPIAVIRSGSRVHDIADAFDHHRRS